MMQNNNVYLSHNIKPTSIASALKAVGTFLSNQPAFLPDVADDTLGI